MQKAIIDYIVLYICIWNIINLLLEFRTKLPLSVNPRAKYSTPKYFEELPLRISKNCHEIIKCNVIEGGNMKCVAKCQLFKVGHLRKRTLYELQECYFIITKCIIKSYIIHFCLDPFTTLGNPASVVSSRPAHSLEKKILHSCSQCSAKAELEH